MKGFLLLLYLKLNCFTSKYVPIFICTHYSETYLQQLRVKRQIIIMSFSSTASISQILVGRTDYRACFFLELNGQTCLERAISAAHRHRQHQRRHQCDAGLWGMEGLGETQCSRCFAPVFSEPVVSLRSRRHVHAKVYVDVFLLSLFLQSVFTTLNNWFTPKNQDSNIDTKG